MNIPPNTDRPAVQSYERYRATQDAKAWRIERRKRHKDLQQKTRKDLARAKRRSEANYAGNMTVVRTLNAAVPSAPSLRKKTPT